MGLQETGDHLPGKHMMLGNENDTIPTAPEAAQLQKQEKLANVAEDTEL